MTKCIHHQKFHSCNSAVHKSKFTWQKWCIALTSITTITKQYRTNHHWFITKNNTKASMFVLWKSIIISFCPSAMSLSIDLTEWQLASVYIHLWYNAILWGICVRWINSRTTTSPTSRRRTSPCLRRCVQQLCGLLFNGKWSHQCNCTMPCGADMAMMTSSHKNASSNSGPFSVTGGFPSRRANNVEFDNVLISCQKYHCLVYSIDLTNG